MGQIYIRYSFCSCKLRRILLTRLFFILYFYDYMFCLALLLLLKFMCTHNRFYTQKSSFTNTLGVSWGRHKLVWLQSVLLATTPRLLSGGKGGMKCLCLIHGHCIPAACVGQDVWGEVRCPLRMGAGPQKQGAQSPWKNLQLTRGVRGHDDVTCKGPWLATEWPPSVQSPQAPDT